ncbi:MAG: hypothetical protein HLUCCA08_03835 [Rhodobacteraceae bacterium HLUCCA08]|nr:MAG: hypothetical protein HLUCCA08_03835 [Rhodobacteraceae bacterium HLUCCA08]
MEVTRNTGDSPRTSELARKIAQNPTTCIGCPGCKGLCQVLIDALTVPDTVLKRAA